MKPQVVSYRKYKDFHNETFLDSSRHEFNAQGQFPNEKGLNPFSIRMLLKMRHVCYYHIPFINNETYKAIMTRSRLKNLFLRNRSEENQKLFCKQRISALHFLKKIILKI